ncbi:serine hydrolase domain-containing protein [Streptomyces sp. NBC_01443]|uniref:serine hydrolase domain-containing protein n=1 Tax=Streptomyces sp. NBC_01443 TaxID=2903868 RepID=UPI002259258B|nr:serine hydrolase domain-containing protein [Streptomyces sp. NBC_01443]MCX4630990.1 beta-lactamase family protein [Streptomyces sp. NBC_01443]
MRRDPARAFAAALLLVSAPAPVASPAAAARAALPVAVSDRYGDDCPPGALAPELSARLDRAVERTRQEAGVPGVIVGLWMPGRGCYVRATGVADTATGEPMQTGLRMRIASETKTFTVTAMLELVDDGLVGLDDPVSKYVAGVPDGGRITLRQLAGMRSGLFPYTADPDFVQALVADPRRQFTPKELLAYGFRHPNTFGPGEKFQYANTNTVLLGLVVEKVSGLSLADFIHQRVDRPAQLGRTLFPPAAEFPSPHAHGYSDLTPTGRTADATDWNPSWGWAAAAMISDLHDLRRWARILATGTLLSPATQAERLKMLPTGLAGNEYGLGIFDNHGWIGHNGSLPGYECVAVHLPSRRATLVVLINTDIHHRGSEPSTLLAKTITGIATPDHVYDIPPQG